MIWKRLRRVTTTCLGLSRPGGARLFPLRLALVIAFTSVVAPAAPPKRAFVVKAPPSWVKTLPLQQTGSSASNEADSGSQYLISDHQIRVTNGSTEHYSRHVRKVLNASALEDLSQVQLEFEPSYQQLVIHHVKIQRGDLIIDALRPDEVKIIQLETDLNQRLYNGTLSALIFLNDVRVGDVVDYAFSVIGQNTVLGSRFVYTFSLAGDQTIEKLQWRLIWPSQRQLHYRGINTPALPVTKGLGDDTEYIWAQENVAPVEFEDSTPSWFSPIPAIQLSEFPDWEAVVQWALPLYALERPIDGPLKKQIDRWRTDFVDPERMLLAALRFVQDDVRYMGIELGPYSHTPTQPSAVFQRRFGDCKDKSLLLSTILNSLGIEASPALVNTSAQSTLNSWLPSPVAFDHAIVRATLNGKTYWIDATANLQRGGLAQLYNPNYGPALVLRDGVRELEEIPREAGETATTEVVEIYTAQSSEGPATLEVSTTYRSADADNMRRWIARQTLPEIGKTYLNYYARFDSDISAVTLPRVLDDPATNTLVITEKYRIPNFWKSKTRRFYAGRIAEDLGTPNVSKRSMPLAVSYPARVSQVIEAHLPEGFRIETDSRLIVSDAIRFEYQYSSAGNTIRLNYQLRTLSDHVRAERVTKHLDTVDQIRNTLDYGISTSGAPVAFRLASLIPISLVLVPFVFFGVFKAVKSVRARRRQTRFRQRTQVCIGETPETAIPLRDDGEIARGLAAFKCGCGISYPPESGPPQAESAVFDGRRLTVIRLNCDACNRFQDVYFISPVTGPTVFQN
jgi:transglutaminase-like putative cysteine protease